jgi:hypothetical protein
MDKKIDELFRMCGIHDFSFTLQKEGEKNFIDYSLTPDKEIIINVPNYEDKEFEKLLDNKINELKELLNKVPTK